MEIVKVVCPVVEGNEHGYYVKNKEDLTPEDVLYQEKSPVDAAADVTEKKAKAKS